MRFLLLIGLLAALPAAAQTPLRTTIAGSGDFAEQASSPVVRPNYGRLFSKASDGGLYYLSDAGAETNLLTGGASASAILAALLTVDGAASLLDADFLDGISSGGFCLTDGTRVYTGDIFFEGVTADAFETTFAITDPTADRTITFKNASGTVAFTSDIVNMSASDILVALLTVDGAGSLLDADFLDGVSSAAFVQTTGDAVLGGGSGSTGCTVTDATGALTCVGNITSTAGDMQLTNGGFTLLMSSNGSVGQSVSGTSATGGIAKFLGGGSGLIIGMKSDIGANSPVITVQDGTTVAFGGTTLFSTYGAGAFGIPAAGQQSITISTGLDSTSPTSSQVELTCTTPACSYSPGETSVVDGWQIEVCNVDTADNISLATAANVVVVRGSPLVMAPGECAACTYTGSIWGCH